MKNSILIDESKTLNRPIQIINGKCFFATSLVIKTSKGLKRIWVISDGGFESRYSEEPLDGHEPFSSAPFHIEMAGIPRPNSTLSAKAYNDHVLSGEPIENAAITFRKVADAIDHFVSFDGSFAGQRDLAEFLTCWAFSTYATDVFDTVGYIWPNGERGSGKTQCLKTLTSLAFMGQTITSSSSFASVRDEAALGATLGFDDCENIAKMEPEKRELLLAGNTKGSGFMLKVPGKRDGSWETKYIDCFAPRCFTSIGLPDDVLASRTTLLMLMRTNDVAKTRRKPTNLQDWPNDPNELRDSMWLNMVSDLTQIAALKEEVNASTDLAGRDFDIFQAPLTVARWLEKKGVDDLFGRMSAVMERYHATKQRNLLPSLEHALLQALDDKLSEAGQEKIVIPTRDVVRGIGDVLMRWDITDTSLTSVDVQKVGMMLGRLGFRKSAAHGRSRSWDITGATLLQKARSAGVTLEGTLSPEADDTDDQTAPIPLPVSEVRAVTDDIPASGTDVPSSGWLEQIAASSNKKSQMPW